MSWYTKKRKDGGTYLGNINDREEPGFYNKTPPWTERQVLRAIKSGEMTIRDIAKEFNVHERTVQRIARKNGVPPRIAYRAPRLTPEVAKKVLTMWSSQTSLADFTALTGYTDFANLKHAVEVVLGVKLGRKPRHEPLDALRQWSPRNRSMVFDKPTVTAWWVRRQSGESWKSIARGTRWSANKCRDITASKRYQHPEWFINAA